MMRVLAGPVGRRGAVHAQHGAYINQGLFAGPLFSQTLGEHSGCTRTFSRLVAQTFAAGMRACALSHRHRNITQAGASMKHFPPAKMCFLGSRWSVLLPLRTIKQQSATVRFLSGPADEQDKGAATVAAAAACRVLCSE
eukprot:3169048-Rhodomonas_salina.2